MSRRRQKKYKLTRKQKAIYKKKLQNLDKYYSVRDGQDGFDASSDEKKMTKDNYCIKDLVEDYESDYIKKVAKFFINVICKKY